MARTYSLTPSKLPVNHPRMDDEEPQLPPALADVLKELVIPPIDAYEPTFDFIGTVNHNDLLPSNTVPETLMDVPLSPTKPTDEPALPNQRIDSSSNSSFSSTSTKPELYQLELQYLQNLEPYLYEPPTLSIPERYPEPDSTQDDYQEPDSTFPDPPELYLISEAYPDFDPESYFEAHLNDLEPEDVPEEEFEYEFEQPDCNHLNSDSIVLEKVPVNLKSIALRFPELEGLDDSDKIFGGPFVEVPEEAEDGDVEDIDSESGNESDASVNSDDFTEGKSEESSMNGVMVLEEFELDEDPPEEKSTIKAESSDSECESLQEIRQPNSNLYRTINPMNHLRPSFKVGNIVSSSFLQDFNLKTKLKRSLVDKKGMKRLRS